jgi:hypothetical protein
MSLFVSSCSRRQWARRRGRWSRRAWYGALFPGLVALSMAAVAAGAFFAGRGGV